jgi:RimJ/RimL family protein N-acetyltransferase
MEYRRDILVKKRWNERSWMLMERLGMRREAGYIESEVTDGEWTDGLIHAILKSEWLKRKEH